MRLVILGGPGSGKGTQAEKLSAQFGIPAISTGEILRSAVAAGSDLGQQVAATLEKGELVSDRVMIDLIQARLNEPDAAQGWILDGYPRTAFQAEELDFLLDAAGQRVDKAIWLEVPAAVLVVRSQNRGAIDDSPEAVKRRIETLLEVTVPMLDYYEHRQRLIRIDGNQSPDEVKRSILAQL
ncbi:MAG: adenylate kinase [Cyanobacteria bacterium J06648_16]